MRAACAGNTGKQKQEEASRIEQQLVLGVTHCALMSLQRVLLLLSAAAESEAYSAANGR